MSKKRKRDHGTDENAGQTNETLSGDAVNTDEPSSNVLSAEETANVRKKIHHAIVLAGRAFKKARDFEIRKIIKRIKAAE
jgi:hypothetical protein